MSDAAVDVVRLRELAVDANCEGGYERDELNRYLTPARVLDLTARLASAEKERGRLQHLDRMMAPHVEKLIAERDTLKAERDELRINVTAITEKVLRYDREVGELKAAVEQAVAGERRKHLPYPDGQDLHRVCQECIRLSAAAGA